MKQLYYCFLLLMGVPMIPNSLLNAQTTVVLPAIKDNTIYSEGVKSNGVGTYLFVGKTEATTNGVRRTLVQFDVSSIPANATITNVQLKLTGSKQAATGIKAHRVTSAWSEGSSNASGQEGGGATASINSSTWAFSNYSSVAWKNIGGDYVATPSASANVNSGIVSIWGGAGMLQDLQDWVSGKASNFGWILIGDENTNGSAVRLNARENSSGKPGLEVTYSVGSTCRLSDSLVLVDLYRSTNGANWKNKWDLGKPMSTWYGVLMNSQGCVTYISLDDNGLVGNLSESIGNLQNLEVLTLIKNDLTGTIPNSIGNLKALEILTMDQHPRFSGSIPSSIGQCTNLMFVYLQVMNLTGTIPAEIGNLKKLKFIFLGGNKLTGSLPQQLSTLDSLVFFNAANNQITGSVPNLSRLKKLKHIGLDFNKLITLTPNIFPLDSLRKKGSGNFFPTTKSGYSFSWYWVQGPFLSNNALTFEDLLPHYNNLFAAPHNYLYAPQDSIYKDTLIQKNTGQSLTIDLGIDASITDNKYTWTKNGQAFKVITGNNKLEFSAIQISDAGTYRVSVTNPRAPLLTLYSKAIRIGVAPSCRSQDSLALVDLYKSTNGANWTNKWDLSKPMNTWYGLQFNSQGCVMSMKFPNNNLFGKLPESLGNLSALEEIFFYNNNITGQIPNSIGNLKNLEILFINDSPNMAGPLPSSIGQCTNLTFIYLTAINLNGTIPSEVGNLKKLKFLILDRNKFSGSIPASIAQIDSLRFFNIANNQLIGTVPDFSRLNKVEHIGLDYNKLNNLSPNTLPLNPLRGKGNVLIRHVTKSNSSLETTWVKGPFFSNNAFTFEDLLPHYNHFFAAPYNYLYAPQDSIYRDTTIRLTAGQPLSIDLGIDASVSDNRYTWFKNNQSYTTLTGTNKLTFSAVKTTDAGTYRVVVTNPQAQALTLYGRNVKIEVNAGVASCRTSDSLELVKLYNATNGPNWVNKWDLTKPMTGWWGVRLNSQGCIICLDLDGVNDCENIITSFSGNNLTGKLPNLQLNSLTKLILRLNKLEGEIPELNFPNLELLDLGGNLLTGKIPNFILVNLKYLNLVNNNLSGGIPNFNLPKLEYLNLAINPLGGTIPNFDLPNLQTLILTNNLLEGSIPNLNLPSLFFLGLESNKLNGSIPNFTNTSKLFGLHLSKNQLSGSIPDLNLLSLQQLFIDHNKLSGKVTDLKLPKLNSLKLSHNQISEISKQTLFNNLTDSLSVNNNNITFEDILLNLQIFQKLGLRGVYAPQDSIYRDTTIRLNTGQALTIDLGIDASITDNQYTWTKNSQTFRTITGNNKLEFPALQATDAGTYRVRVTNPRAPALTLYSKAIRIAVNNCVANANLNSSATSDNICNGTNITLSASGGNTYRWSTGQNTSSINLSITQNQTVTVSITDAGGCTQTLSRNLVALSLPKAEISSSGTTICTGGKLSLSAAQVSGAQYQWLRNNTSVLGPGSASTYEATQAGSYTVQVNVAGCTNTSAPLVVQQSSSNTAFKLNLSPTRDTLCPGDSVQISASGGLKYTWSTGSSSSGIVVKPVQSSTYAVTVADAGNCTSILRQTISLVSAPQSRPRLSDLNCGFTLLAAGTGGRTPYRYRWSTGSTNSSVTVTKGGNYELLLVDARQCSAKASIVVDSFSFLTAAPILLDPNCGAVDGSITLQLDPKREPYQIEWSPSAEGQGDNPRTKLDAGSYQALILDKQGCMDTIEVTLNKQEDCDKDFLIYRSFSPNRDGVNEYFVIQAKRTGGCPSGALNECYPNNELIIFNRWGEAVYRKKGYTSDWDADGYPGGAYFFLFYPDRNKPKGVIRGALTVLK